MSKLENRSGLRKSLGVVLAFTAIGCGPQFDPPSKLQSLRVLAVKKDDPYVWPTSSSENTTDGYRPDDTVHMTLAYEDGRLEDDKQGPLQKLWFGGCNNPPGDNYFTCMLSVWLSFKAFSELGPGELADGQSWTIADLPNDEETQLRIYEFLKDNFPKLVDEIESGETPVSGSATDDLLKQAMALRVGAGDTFDYTVPSWVIGQHVPPSDPNLPRYGMSAVCYGEVGISPDWEKVEDPLAILTDATRGFPLTCYGRRSGKERGADHFMVSYSNVYMYDELTNRNPVIEGFKFDGKRVDDRAVCIGEACVTAEDVTCDGDSVAPKVDLCRASSEAGCKQYEIEPVVSEGQNQELDYVASHIGGSNRDVNEQLWIRYYADQGSILNEVKLLQEVNEGWVNKHYSKWTAWESTTGLSHLWSVVYDNRGGVDWARLSVCLE
jgi:hypothetical protein